MDPNKPFLLSELPPKLTSGDLMKPDLIKLLIRANSALAELNGTCRAINNPAILLNIPMLQESVASSEIEGIHTTVETALEDQVKAEHEQSPASKEALRYREAIDVGFESARNYLLSTRTILAIHHRLMPKGGRFRSHQNQIAKGSTIVYTPPEPSKVSGLIGNWENFVHPQDSDFDALVRVAIAHYQFEAIHPFSDGNGRTGRILMVLQMVQDGLLDSPILYISGYLTRNRKQYYDLLSEVTEQKNWIGFIEFMLTAIEEQAKTTQKVIFKIMAERDTLKRRLRKELKSIYTPDLLDHIFSYPVTYPTFMSKKMGIVYQTASKHLSTLESAGVLTKRKSGRNVLYYNIALLNCLRT